MTPWSYHVLLPAHLPRTTNTFVFRCHWLKILGTGGEDDHPSHTVVLLRLWNSERWINLFSWWSWAMVVKEYELDTDREKNKAKQKLPESGKWGIILLPALSRHIIQWSKWKMFNSSLGQEAGFTHTHTPPHPKFPLGTDIQGSPFHHHHSCITSSFYMTFVERG